MQPSRDSMIVRKEIRCFSLNGYDKRINNIRVNVYYIFIIGPFYLFIDEFIRLGLQENWFMATI